MRQRIKKGRSISVLALIVVMIATSINTSFATDVVRQGEPNTQNDDLITVTIDGEVLEFPEGYGQPFIQNERTLVPLRGVTEAMGAIVTYDEETATPMVEMDGIKVETPIGEKNIIVDGEIVENDVASIVVDERTYLPIRVVLEAFGAEVGWEQSSRTVIIATDGKIDDEHPGYAEPEQANNEQTQAANEDELKAMWISYLEYAEMPKDEDGFKEAIDDMFEQCVDYNMNAVIVQVRPDSDAMYDSDYYPWSSFASGTQGVDPGYDPMEYMIDVAQSMDLEFHAWINPYRVTGTYVDWEDVADSSPIKTWLTDSDPSNDRAVLFHNGNYYLNPSSALARELVINGVEEIVENYDVDGIHFDDYFYPSLNDNDPEAWFDKPEYDLYSGNLSIADWRRENVNILVREVYDTVKAADQSIVFGISPAGNVSNLRASTQYFVDIDEWMSEDGYIDYIMPQLYWGFERRDSTGNIASYAYENNLNTWIDLKNKGDVELHIGYNLANAGTSVYDNNAVSEWLRYDDIIKRQIEEARETGAVSGFAFFRYDIFSWPTAQSEVKNLVDIL